MASTVALPGFTGFLYATSSAVGSSGAPVTANPVAELQDVTLSITATTLDAFSKDSSGWDEGIQGKKSFDLAGKAIYRDTTGSTGQESFVGNILSTSRYSVGFSLKGAASSGTLYWSGGGIVTKWDLSQPLEGVDTYDFALKGTGSIGRGTSSGT